MARIKEMYKNEVAPALTMEKAVSNLLRGGFITKDTADKATGVIDNTSAIAAMQSAPKMNYDAPVRPRI